MCNERIGDYWLVNLFFASGNCIMEYLCTDGAIACIYIYDMSILNKLINYIFIERLLCAYSVLCTVLKEEDSSFLPLRNF